MWEEIAENTFRLELEDGQLYRFGSSMVYVPPDVSDSLYELKELFKEATFEMSEGRRAIRNGDTSDG
jgi:hypothetical protein